MNEKNFCLEDIQSFLQEKILHKSVAKVQKFSKGQLPVLCLTLDDSEPTKLIVKFYRSLSKVMQSLKIAQAFNQNPELKSPRLYPLSEGYFQYGSLFGLIFYYIPGEEISSAKITEKHFNQLADMYAVFQSVNVDKEVLHQEHSQKYYLDMLLRYQKRIQKIVKAKKNLFSKLYMVLFLKIYSRFLTKLKADYSQMPIPKQKITHNDMTKSNLLFKDGNFAAFIDMDSVVMSCPGRDCAEFIVSSAMRFRFWRSRRHAIQQWYAAMDKRLHFSREEYLYGLNIYYLYRIYNYISRRQYLSGFLKLYNFAQFIKLHKTIVAEVNRLKK